MESKRPVPYFHCSHSGAAISKKRYRIGSNTSFISCGWCYVRVTETTLMSSSWPKLWAALANSAAVTVPCSRA